LLTSSIAGNIINSSLLSVFPISAFFNQIQTQIVGGTFHLVVNQWKSVRTPALGDACFGEVVSKIVSTSQTYKTVILIPDKELQSKFRKFSFILNCHFKRK
jgi:hypothetical protein